MDFLIRLLSKGSVLLAASALLSKVISFVRDRLILDTFDPAAADLIFAAFRVPDFFFYLLVGATISVIFIPRLVELDEDEQREYFASFLWGVLICFGAICAIGTIFAPQLVQVIFSGFDAQLQSQIAELSRYLFGSIFLLSLSSVFAAQLQAQEKFFTIALAPLLYVCSIVGSLFIFRDQFGILIVGYGAIFGSLLHLLLTSLVSFVKGTKVHFSWLSPRHAWDNFWPDFGRRVFNNAAFQINQTVDLWIASFLLIGSITSFTLGTTLGHFLLSILGMAVANVAFPRLAKVKHQKVAQAGILRTSSLQILAFAIPFSLLCAFLAEPILQLLFNLEGTRLAMTKTVFWWTVISLPFACLIPLFSRFFLANDDTSTPMWINIISLTIATTLAAILALKVFPADQAILGLALGNFTANTLSCGLFALAIYRTIKTA